MAAFLILLPFLAVSATAFSLAERQDITTVGKVSNQLAVDIYKEISSGDDNVFISPLSISTALGMLYAGARGETADEMNRALGYRDAGLTDSEVHAAFKNVMETFTEDSDSQKLKYTLYVANAALVQKDYSILPQYKDVLLKNYKAVARDVDFQNEGAKAVEEINDWVKLKTNNQIDKLLDELDPSTIMVLLSAIYFKGTWKTQFDPEETYGAVFFNKGLKTEQKKVDMMHLVDEFPVLRLGGAKLIELPYDGEDISMVIVLPNELNGLSKLEQYLEPNMLRDMRRRAKKEKMHLALPKFKVEYSKSLNDPLKDLGIKYVFQNNADLSGISKAGPIAVSEVMHKAVIEVNEQGSEASAVTGIVVETRMGLLEDDRFNADHPFLYSIVDKKTDTILFLGRINQL